MLFRSSLYFADNLTQFLLFGIAPSAPPDPIPDSSPPIISQVYFDVAADGSQAGYLLISPFFNAANNYMVAMTAPVSPGRLSLRSETYGNLLQCGVIGSTEIFQIFANTDPRFFAQPGMRTGFRVTQLNFGWLQSVPTYFSAIPNVS